MEKGTRGYVSMGLAVVGAFLALVGGFALYAREEVFKPESFSRHASESLRDERVRTALTGPIVDQVVANGPDQLINARPLLVTAVDGAIGSGPFRDLFRKASKQVYSALFSKERDTIFLTIDDIDTIVADAAGSISPQVGERVPRDFGRRLVEITDDETLITVAETSEDVRFLGILLPFLALGCLIGAVVVAPDRRQGLMTASGSLAVAAALGLIGLLVARGMVVGQFESDTTQDAVRAVWDAYFGGLRTWTMVIGGGAVVVAAAAATARQVDPEAPARRVMRVVGREPKTAAGRAGRAVGVAALGLFVVLRPDLSVNIAAVLFGAYALFYASCELMALIAPPRSRQMKLRKPTGREALIGAGVAAVAVALVLAIFAISGDGEEGPVTRPEGEVVNCNGFAELCDRRLNEVAFASSHNGMSAAELPGWFAPNQRYGVKRQLRDGLRGLLVDSHYGIARRNGPVMTDFSKEDEGKVLAEVRAKFGPDAALRFQRLSDSFNRRGGEGEQGEYFCHVVCELGSTPMRTEFGWIREFLDTHPDEVVVLFIEDAVSPKDTADAFADSGLLRYAYVHERNEPLPTLREMIDSDRRLFVMAEKTGGGAEFPWYHQGFELTQETPYTFHSEAELADYDLSCLPNRGDASSPLFQLNNWVEVVPRLPSTARRVNSFEALGGRAEACRKIRGLLPNLLAVDFYDEGDVLGVANVLNGLPRDATPTYRQTGG